MRPLDIRDYLTGGISPIGAGVSGLIESAWKAWLFGVAWHPPRLMATIMDIEATIVRMTHTHELERSLEYENKVKEWLTIGSGRKRPRRIDGVSSRRPSLRFATPGASDHSSKKRADGAR